MSMQSILSIDITPQYHMSISSIIQQVVRFTMLVPNCPTIFRAKRKRQRKKKTTCIEEDMLSLSLRISCRFLVPKMFLRVVWASSLQTTSFSWYCTSFLFDFDKKQPLPCRVMSILHIGHTNLEKHQYLTELLKPNHTRMVFFGVKPAQLG